MRRQAGYLVVGVLVAGGAAAIAQAPVSGGAQQTTSVQGVQADVAGAVSWGSASGCAQNIQTNDFGALTPNAGSSLLGAFGASPGASASTDAHGNKVWVGCVSSNGRLVSVVAQGVQDMTATGGLVLPLSDVAIGVSNQPGGSASPQCAITAGQSGAGGCTLPNDGATVRELAGEAPPGTMEIDWQYQLDLPANQRPGAYGGGVVVFTATANAPESEPSNTVPPELSEPTPQVGVGDSVSTGTWTGNPTSYAYQWERCGNGGAGCVDIAGATSSTYTPAAADLGHTLRARVSATNFAGTVAAVSVASAEVLPVAPSNSALPVISPPSPQQGVLESTSNGTWTNSPTSYAYQWLSCDSAGENCSSVSGATASTYTPVAGDVGHTLRVKVTASNAGGSGSVTSDPTSQVIPEPPTTATPGPEISGEPIQGATLTTTNGTFVGGAITSTSYQWLRCESSGEGCVGIAGATTNSYTLTASDVDHTIRAEVLASNAAGSASETSSPTALIVGPPILTSAPVISPATPQQGAAESVSNGTWSNGPTHFSYQWLSCDSAGENCSTISGATNSAYTPVSTDVGHTLRAEVSASNAAGETHSVSSASQAVLPAAPSNTLAPAITSENPTVGIEESASTGTWTGSPTSYTYQWEDCDSVGESCSDISGATASTYTPVAADAGSTLVVSVTASNAGGSAQAHSPHTSLVTDAPSNTALPTLSSASPTEGQAVSTTTGSWEGFPSPSYTYQWQRCDALGAACTNIAAATSSSYTPVAADVGMTIRSIVTASNSAGTASAESAVSEVLTGPPVNTQAPELSSSSPVEGTPLSASNGTWRGYPAPSFTYQWQDCNGAGENCTNIAGATASSYTPASGDVGHTLKATVTATNTSGSGSASTSASNAVLPLAPTSTSAPTLSSNSPVEGMQLSTTNGSWTRSPTSFGYQWLDCNSAGEGCASISGATSSSYTPVAGDVGHALRVEVTATNAGGSGKATSAATGVVVPPAPVNTALPVISSSSPQQGVADFVSNGTWSNSPTSFAYQWEDCNSAGESCANISGATSSSYTPQASDVGHTLRTTVTASNAGGSGSATSAATAVVVPPAPVNTALPVTSSNSPQQGVADSVSNGTWSNNPTSFSYQWQDCNNAGEACSNISGATSASYTPQASDVGHTLRAKVTASNAGGSGSATSAASAEVVPAAPVNTTAPVLSSETPTVGVVETATTGTWSNSPTGYSYQWLDCNASGEACANISGATSSSYTPTAGDAGHTLVVHVTASNAGGSGTFASSTHTNAVTEAPSNTVLPTLSTNSPTEGVAINTTTGTWAGYPVPTYTYQWQRCNAFGGECANISGATNSTYTPVAADVEMTIQAVVKASNSVGSSTATTLVSNIVTGPPVNTIAPSLSNSSPVEGTALSVSNGTWKGYPAPTYAYQWQDCNSAGEACSNISGATSSTYTPVAADVGKTLKAKVTGTNTAGSGSASSSASNTVVPPPPANTTLPAVSPSTPQQGVVESSTNGSWSNSPTSFSYQWEDCNGSGEACANISGATSSSYMPVASDVGHTLRVKVTASNAGGSGSATSAASNAVLPAAPANTALPTVSPSTPQQGVAESTTNGTWSNNPTSFSYQWLDCNNAGEGCSSISGATSASYTPVASDVGHTLRVEVTATNAGGSGKATSAATSVVVPPAPVNTALPTLSSNSPQQGVADSVSNGAWTNNPTGFSYQWQRCNLSGTGCTSISGATGASYTPTEADLGHTLRAVVTASNAGGQNSASSTASTEVLPAVPVNTAPPVISSENPKVGTAITASTGSWSNSPTSFSYQWEDCNSAGEGCTNISGATSSSYTPVAADAGLRLRVAVTASNAGGSGSATSAATNAASQTPTDTALPTLSTTSPAQGVALSTSNGSWTGYPAPSFTYQWQQCNGFGGECANISGATSSSYTPVEGDVGKTLQAVVTATNSAGSANATTPVSNNVTGPPVNTALPTLSSNSAVQGTALSVSNGTWRGYPAPSFAYQWLDCNGAGEACSSIAGATSSSYTPVEGDVEHRLRARVTASNSAGTGTATTTPSNAVLPLAPGNTSLPVVSPSTPQQGVVESTTNGSWSNSPTSFSYQWEDCNSAGEACSSISGATSSSYTPVAGDVGHALRVEVTATNAGGSGKATSVATGVVVPPAPVNTALPVISSGSPQQGVADSVSNGTWSNSPTSFAYQWEDCNSGGEGCANIAGATSSSYTPAESDVGHTLRVKVTASNAGGSSSATSAATAAVVPAVPVNSVLPVISPSSPQQGVVESTTNGTWSNSPTSFGYQWEDCNGSGEGCANITGATSSSYTPTESDVGHTLRVKVTASNAGGSGSATSNNTAAVLIAAPVNTALPVISSSSPQQGVVESTTNGTWSHSPTSYGYQWEDCNSAGESCANISGATSSSYTPVEGDVGHTLRAKITATNAGGSGSATSNNTSAVLIAAPVSSVLPVISPSSPRQGVVESTTNGTWTQTPTSYSYQWEDCNSLGEGCLSISGATSASYTPAASDVGDTLRVKVTATNAGGSGVATSEATGVVVPPTPVNSVLPVVSPSSPRQGVVESTTNGTWSNSPTSYSYQWEDCNNAGESCSTISGATSSSYTPVEGDVGHTLRVKVTAANAGGSGVATSEATGVVVPPAPVNSVLPVVSPSSPRQGVVESTTNGTWSHSPTSYGYQWEDCNSAGESCANISGATSSSYTPVEGDVGHTLRAKITATNAGGSGSATSEPTAVVVPPAPVNSLLPAISPSSPQQGVAESTTTGTWSNSPTSYSYQWEDCNNAGESCANISGATSSSYTPVEGDVGHTLRVEVTATNSGGSGHAASAATATVLGKPTNTVLPAITESRTGGLGALNTADGTNDLAAVSCPSSGFCVAVDASGNVLTTTNSGSSWAVTAISGTPAFVAVSCAPGTTPTSGLCAATTTSVHAYLATDPTGGAADWVESASFTGSEPPGGISCANTAFCVAVAGGYTNIGAVSGTAITWTENSANASSFAGVSCTSETFCAHIDSSAGVVYTTTPKTIAAWAATSGVTLTGGTGEALSCAPGTTSTSGLCVDVGTSGRIAVATDPAGTWTTSTIDGAHTITSVSCASTSFCMAVDNAGNVLISRTPTEASSWSPTGSGAADLTGVSCYSTTFCVIIDNLGQDAVYSGAAVTTLQGSSGTWTNSPTSYKYQWERCNTSGAECSNISGATGSSRTETGEDSGHTLRVEVTATNAVGSGTATSIQSLVAGAPVNTAIPAIDDLGPGTLSEPYTADQLEATDGIWANEPTSYTYQWERCNSSGAECSNISGATEVEYEPVSADIGHTLRVVITVTNSDGSAKVTTTQTGMVKLAPPVNVVLPAITGSPVVAQVLTASNGTWNNEPTSYTYQWEDCNTSGAECTNISSATSSSYTVASTDVGHTIRVVVTATNSTGSAKATSTATARVASAAPVNTVLPAITGTDKVGERLTGSTGTWSNEPTSFKYQWERCNASGAECSNISGATGSSHIETGEDSGHTLRVEVTATNAAGSGTATSNSTPTISVASQTQSVDANALAATSCVPSTTDCVVSDNKGNAYYSTNVKVTGTATWTLWTGPVTTASAAIACPSTSLCVLADGGSVYYATSLGGAWTLAFSPAYPVDALTCPTSSFCIDGQGAEGGYIRYSDAPASTTWTAVDIAGINNVPGVWCVSSSFCTAVDSVGDLHIANTETKIKEVPGWTSTDIDGTTALTSIACTSTTSCVAVDGVGNAIGLAISGSIATATKHSIDSPNSLTAVTCTGTSTCVAVDNKGNVFTSTNSGETWTKQLALGTDLTSVSCASSALCAATNTAGGVTTFEG